MGNRHVKTCLILLIITEMLIKSTMRYHRQNGHHQKSTNKTCWRKYGEGELSRAVGGNTNWCNQYGKEYGDPTKTRVPYDPAVLLLGIYTEETKIQKGTCTAVFTAAVLATARARKQLKCPWQTRGGSRCVTYTAGHHSGIGKNGVKQCHPQQQGWT